MNKVVIIGGGAAGCAAAHALKDSKNDYEVTLIDVASELGAGVRTYFKGGHPYTFGPRHFFTKNERIYSYLNSKIPLYDCGHHQFITYVESDGEFYHYPVNYEDIPRMPDSKEIYKELDERKSIEDFEDFEDYWIKSIGPTLYRKFIKSYNQKMWQLHSNKQFDTFKWSPKTDPISKKKQALYDFNSAYPEAIDGYNDFFDQIYDFTSVRLNTKVDSIDWDRNLINIGLEQIQYDFLLITVSPDIFFNFEHGMLPYIGRDITQIVLPTEVAFHKDVFFTYYAGSETYTRIVEYKKFSRYKSNSTLIGLEIPSNNGRHYPLPIKREMELARKYQDQVPDNVRFSGRAGSYRYMVDIDDCIEQGLEFAKWLDEGASYEGHSVLLKRCTEFA